MSIDAVVDKLAELINRSLVLYDSDLDVVAYSAHAGDVDRARRMTILTRRGTSRAREMMRVHRAASNVGPLRLPEEEGMPARIIYPVRHEGYVQGYLAYVELGAVEEVAPAIRAELERHAAELGSLLLIRNLDRQENRARLRMLVSDVVSDDAALRAPAARSLVADKLLPVAAEYSGAVLVLADAAGLASAQQRTMLEAALLAFTRAARHPATGAVTEGTAVVLVAGRNDAGAPPVRPSRRDGADVRIGIGAPVRELSEVVVSVRQARIAARACRVDPERYPGQARWDEMGLDRILLQLPLEELTIDDLPAAVARLLDPTAGPDLAATVEAYLDCAGDAQATAARLGIHRSTFYYRLDRARELTGADLHDGVTRRELHTGLRIARLAGLGSRVSAERGQTPLPDGPGAALRTARPPRPGRPGRRPRSPRRG